MSPPIFSREGLQERERSRSEIAIDSEAGALFDSEELPMSPVLRVEKRNNPWYGMSQEEVEDRKEFIRCYLNKEFEVILQIPVEPHGNDNWAPSHQEFMESAFNTWDFQRNQRPFNKYAYRIRKVMEQVKELAILHSSISRPEGKANTQKRYENLVQNEYRGLLLYWVEHYKRAADEERIYQIKRRIAELNRRILQCQKVWEEYANWE